MKAITMKAGLLICWCGLAALARGGVQIRREDGLAAASLLAPQVFEDAARKSSEQAAG